MTLSPLGEKRLSEILNAVFMHGKHTPDMYRDLPEGQMTVAEAFTIISDNFVTKNLSLEELKSISKDVGDTWTQSGHLDNVQTKDMYDLYLHDLATAIHKAQGELE